MERWWWEHLLWTTLLWVLSTTISFGLLEWCHCVFISFDHEDKAIVSKTAVEVKILSKISFVEDIIFCKCCNPAHLIVYLIQTLLWCEILLKSFVQLGWMARRDVLHPGENFRDWPYFAMYRQNCLWNLQMGRSILLLTTLQNYSQALNLPTQKKVLSYSVPSM